MAKVTFAKPGAAPAIVAPAPVAAPAPAPAPVAAEVVTETVQTPTPVAEVTVESTNTSAVVPYQAPAAPARTQSFYDDDSMDAGDLVLPRLNIVQKVGDLSNVFVPGTIVLNGQLELAKAPAPNAESAPLNLLVIGFQPTIYAEKVEGGLRGNLVNSEQEVVAKGGTLDWNEYKQAGKPLYQRLATAMVLIEQPAGLDASSFPVEVCGKRYALALYSMKGTSYTNGAKHFKSARKIGHLCANGYRGGFWLFSSKLKKFESNYAFIPVVRPSAETSEEFRAALKDFLGF